MDKLADNNKLKVKGLNSPFMNTPTNFSKQQQPKTNEKYNSVDFTPTFFFKEKGNLLDKNNNQTAQIRNVNNKNENNEKDGKYN